MSDYVSALAVLQCPMCGGERIDDPKPIRGFVGGLTYVAKPSLLGTNCLETRGRACIDCGFIMLVVNVHQLQKTLKLPPTPEDNVDSEP